MLAQAVRIKPSCLTCHGNPANSPNGDGRDYLGLTMENMKVGDLAGIFVLRAPFNGDPVLASTVWKMMGVSLVIGLVMFGCFAGFNRQFIERPLFKAIRRLTQTSAAAREASRELTNASTSLADGANQQAAALQETSASLVEIAAQHRGQRQVCPFGERAGRGDPVGGVDRHLCGGAR